MTILNRRFFVLGLLIVLAGCVSDHYDQSAPTVAAQANPLRLEELVRNYRQVLALSTEAAIADYKTQSQLLRSGECTLTRYRLGMLLTRMDVISQVDELPSNVMTPCQQPDNVPDQADHDFAMVLKLALAQAREQNARMNKLADELTRQQQQIDELKDIERSIQRIPRSNSKL